jgi:NitT/TauT family transport system substrate-binding protein
VKPRLHGVSLVALVLALIACGAGSPAAPAAKPAVGAGATTGQPATSAAQSSPQGSAPAAAPQRRAVNYGLVNYSAFYWPIYIALDAGFFDREGLDVETVMTRSGPDGLAAMMGGSVDIITTNSEVVVLAQARGADVIGVSGFNNRASYSMMVQPEIQRLTDLRGKTVGASALRAGEVVFMKALLRKYGLTESDYDLVVAGPSRNRVSAMQTHQIVGTIMPPPDNYRLEDMGMKRIAEVSEAVPDYQFQVLAVTRQWAQANPEVVVRFLRAFVNASHWLYDPANKDRAVAILADRMQLEGDHAARTYQQWIVDEKFFPLDGEAPTSGLIAMEELLVSSGEASPPLPSRDRYMDLKYLEQAKRP